jgi:hypothetical protein
MKIKPITTIKSSGEATELAMKWQKWQSQKALSYGELSEWQDFFIRLAEKFNLEEEFKENAII